MALILILALPVVLVGSYGTWFLYRGLGHEPAVRLARELVARDGIARQVLGTPVEVTGIQANAWSWMPGTGAQSRYMLSLSGPRGNGSLEVHAHAGRNGPQLDEATLIAPDGQRYDLLHHRPLPGAPDLDDTI
jgi:hypothetical protein